MKKTTLLGFFLFSTASAAWADPSLWNNPYLPSARSGQQYAIHYTQTEQSANENSAWMKVGFDDFDWTSSLGPVGSSGYGVPAGTAALGTTIADPSGFYYIRRQFTLEQSLSGKTIYLACGHDDEGAIYIDGTKIVEWGNEWNDQYVHTMTAEQTALLTAGTHVIAMRAKNNSGGYYWDCGLYGEDVTFTATKQSVGDASKLFDGDATDGKKKWEGSAVNNNVYITNYALFQASAPIYVNGVTIYTANDDATQPNRSPRTWRLYGSNTASAADNSDDASWVMIQDMYTAMPNTNATPNHFLFNPANTAYQYFKFEVTSLGGDGWMQVGELELDFSMEAKPRNTNIANGGGNNNEGAENLFDGTSRTKWCKGNSVSSNWVVFKSSSPIFAKKYAIQAANDSEPRDPKKFKLYGARGTQAPTTDGSTTGWTLIDTETDATSKIRTERFSYAEFEIDDPSIYQFYMLKVEETRNATDPTFQMSELVIKNDATEEEFEAESHSIQVSELKAAAALSRGSLSESDPWWTEYKTPYDALDTSLSDAISHNSYVRLEGQLATVSKLYPLLSALIGGATATAIDGTNCWGDGHYSQLIDRDESTKWGGDFSGSEGDANHVQYVIFRIKDSMQPYFYKLVTGGDTQFYTGRNWDSWKVYGANFASIHDVTSNVDNWTLLDERNGISEDYLPMKNNYPATFNFSEGVDEPYYYYMVRVTKAHSGEKTQMSEMYLCTQAEFETIRAPYVEEFADFDATRDVSADLEDERDEFVSLYDELKTTDDAVRLTIVYNRLVALRTMLESSMLYYELVNHVTQSEGVFLLGTATDLAYFAQAVNGGNASLNAKLTADIVTPNTYTPIGTTSFYYNGSFDGDGHSITLNLNNTAAKYQGLFGCATDGAAISNLIVRGTVSANSNSAALIGEVKGDRGTVSISRVGTEATVTGTGGYIGAFVGNNWGGTVALQVQDCYNTGDVTGSKNTCVMGGYIGAGNTFTNVYNSGTITGSDVKFVWNNSGTFTNCFTTSKENAAIDGLTQEIGSEMIANGELCAALGSAFTQDLGQTGHPTFGSKTVTAGKWFNDTAIDVYYNVEDGNYTAYALNLGENNAKYAVPANTTAINVSVSRTLKADKWNTFCVPFPMTAAQISSQLGEEAQVKELTGITLTGEHYAMSFADASTIEAGKPYLVKVTDEVTSIEVSDAGGIAINAAGTPTQTVHDGTGSLTYHGVYTSGMAPRGSFIISNNKFYTVDSIVTLKAFRGYITVDGSAGVKALDFFFDDDTTGIGETLDAAEEDGTCYNLAGQRLQKPQRGINIVGGKKVLK